MFNMILEGFCFPTRFRKLVPKKSPVSSFTEKRPCDGRSLRPYSKIGSCFLKAEEEKKLNCVSASAAARHIGASIKPDP